MRTISSRQTAFTKLVLPVFWTVAFGSGTLALWLLPDNPGGTDSTPSEMKWMFLLLWVLGAAMFWYFGGRLKRVRLDGQDLLISNYIREIRVPLSQIEAITENRWVNLHPVTLHLRSASAFGRKIVFMPKLRFFALWSSHPIVAELRQLAWTARPTRVSGPFSGESPVSWPRRIATIAGVVALLGLGSLGLVELLLRMSDPYRQGVAVACGNPEVRSVLGSPIHTGWHTAGSINWAGPASRADLRIVLHGPRGKGLLVAEADRATGHWRFGRLTFLRDGDTSPIVLPVETAALPVGNACR